MSDDFHPISPAGEMFDEAWKLDDDKEMPFFSFSFSRDEDDLLNTLIDQQDAQGPDGLIPFTVDSTSLPRYSFDECYDDDSLVSPDTHASSSAEPEEATSSNAAAASETSPQSRKRKIVTPQQRRRQVEMQQWGRSHCSSSTSIRRVSSPSCYHTASRMLSCMQRSEATRAQILEHFPSQEDHPVAKKRRSVQDCFLHTHTSRERILSWLK